MTRENRKEVLDPANDPPAEEAGVVLRLSPEAVADLEASDPACAIAFHRALARALSHRLVTSNDFIQSLVR